MLLQHTGIPIYLQVKMYILDKIKTGEYKAGAKLPTERQLSSDLRISRNTVSAAYKELLLEGVLEAAQGRGTFVAGREPPNGESLAGSRRERVVRLVDEMIAKALELGLTVEQFAAIVAVRAKEKAEAVRDTRVAVVDCTEDYLRYFCQQISQLAPLRTEPVLLSDLETGTIAADLLNACDLVITTAQHQAVVGKFITQPDKLVIVSAAPRLEAVIRLARIPHDAAVGVIASSEQFVTTLERLLLHLNLGTLNFTLASALDAEALRSFIHHQRIILVAERYEHLARRLMSPDQELIVFSYEIDQGSLQRVLSQLIR